MAAPRRCFLIDLDDQPDDITLIRIMGRLVNFDPATRIDNNEHDDETMTVTTTATAHNNNNNFIILVLDDGSGCTASIVAPCYMWENLSMKEMGQLMECVATAESHDHSTSSSSNENDQCHHFHRRIWVAQALMVIVDNASQVETLRMLQLSMLKKSSSLTLSTSSKTMSTTFGYPTLTPSAVTGQDILHLIQTGMVGSDQDTSSSSKNGVSLQDLSLILDLPESQVYEMVQELQDQGLVYDKNNQQSYVPL